MSEPTGTRHATDRGGDDPAAIAGALAGRLAEGAGDRDAERRLPYAEVAGIAADGLLGISVPTAHGGPGAGPATVAEVLRLIGTADLSIAQVLQPHFAFLNALRLRGGPAARQRLYSDVLKGTLVANAQAERGGAHSHDQQARLERAASGGWTLTGTKFYATGSLFAGWLAVTAKADVPGEAEPQTHIAFVPREAPGLHVEDDWNGMGQRTTGSGTVRLDRVEVADELVLPHYLTFREPTTYGAYAQLLHSAIDVGLARGALTEAARFVRTTSRPWSESGATEASADPLTVQRFGELEVQVRAAEALLSTAAGRVADADAGPTDASTAEASISVAAAKVAGGAAAVDVAGALFEVAGTRSAGEDLNLHRFWRDARTHTLHDPARWKVQHIGRYSLNGQRPPRHGQI
ncbi:SfnB family sulfur acquisition oxidoreductase [Nocardiopsis mangrovi]|uniref:Dibenzothiophene monooxygenase n=1 Tax=Nocardiopsis mangrovi TaxID=1179818 RepID=A0ABV9DYB4_9ACTN